MPDDRLVPGHLDHRRTICRSAARRALIRPKRPISRIIAIAFQWDSLEADSAWSLWPRRVGSVAHLVDPIIWHGSIWLRGARPQQLECLSALRQRSQPRPKRLNRATESVLL